MLAAFRVSSCCPQIYESLRNELELRNNSRVEIVVLNAGQ
jgi:hypothetical protein